MEQELLPIFFTVIISAVMQVDLNATFAVVELTYKLLWLVLWFLRMICKSRQKNAHPTLTMQIHEVLRQRIVINYNMQGLHWRQPVAAAAEVDCQVKIPKADGKVSKKLIKGTTYIYYEYARVYLK